MAAGATADELGRPAGHRRPDASGRPADGAARMRASRRLCVAGYGFDADWHPTPEPVIVVGPGILRAEFHRAGRSATSS
jgi:hypothetical protein